MTVEGMSAHSHPYPIKREEYHSVFQLGKRHYLDVKNILAQLKVRIVLLQAKAMKHFYVVQNEV